MRDFSLAGYRDLLSAFKNASYTFCRFEDINARLAQKDPFIVLRHDIDISLRPALEFARLEYEQGISATYFVLLRSPFYNLFSRANMEIMLHIHRLGHQIAAHLDLAAYNNDCTSALAEVDVLSRLYPYVNPQLISLHSSYDLHHIPVADFPQLDAVYGAAARGAMAYSSDSTGRWRYGHPLDSQAFKTRQPFQLLTHPIWWVQDGETPTHKLENWLAADYQHNQAILKQFLPKLFKLDR